MVAIVAVGAGVGCGGDPSSTTDDSPSSPDDSHDAVDREPQRPVFDASFEGVDAAVPPAQPASSSSPQRVPVSCEDSGDPGGDEGLAKALPNTDDCMPDAQHVSGVISGEFDVDFYKLFVADRSFCSIDPRFETPTAGIEMCVFIRCQNSKATAVTGCQGGTRAKNSTGYEGCCSSTPGQVTPVWNCGGFLDDDSADIFLRIRPTGTAACLPYSFSYSF